MRERRAKTLVEDVRAQLREEILTGRLSPGTRLKTAEMTAQLEVSSSVLREALAQLAQQNFVTVRPQIGYAVVELSSEALIDLTQARRHIETNAVRESVAAGDLQWSAAVITAHHILVRTPMTSPDQAGLLSREWAEAHLAFHTSLLAACPSSTLAGIARSLQDSYEIYRQWAPDFGVRYEHGAMAEHDALVLAAQNGDAERAAAVLDQHIDRSTAALLACRAGQPASWNNSTTVPSGPNK